MKRLIYFFITISLTIGCKDISREFVEKSYDFETLKEYTDEYGEPDIVVNNEDYKDGNDELLNFNDRFPTNLKIEEIVSMLYRWNYLSEITWVKTGGKYRGTFSNTKYVNSDEWLWLEKNYPKTSYQESSRNRIKRQNMINELFTEKLFWNQSYLMNDDCIRDGSCVPNKTKYSKTGIVLYEIPSEPFSKYEYIWNLGESTYGKHFDDNDIPSETKIEWFGRVTIGWENDNIRKPDTYFTYQKVTLCQCLTDPKYSNTKPCKEKFWNRYKTDDPSIEQMEIDYYNCKNN